MNMIKRKSSRAYSQQTQQTMPRSVPKQICQSSIKHNYESLAKIPTVEHPQSILHLYLSHNKIQSLEGIQMYSELQSINISYNEISKVQELRRIKHPHKLKHLKMRMNPLQYGYQDYAISIFPELVTFQDMKITKESRELNAIMRQFISKHFLNFYEQTNQLLSLMEGTENNKENHSYNSNKNENISLQLTQKDATMIKYLMIELKKLFVFPTQENLRNMPINNMLTLSSEVIKNSCESLQNIQASSQHYIERRKKLIQEIFEAILIKFSARHDKTFVNELHKMKNSENYEQMIHCFAKMGIFTENEVPEIEAKMSGGAIKSPLIGEKAAKYLKKQPQKPLKEHPMNRLVNWQQPEYNTLIPFEKTKFYQVYDKNQEEKAQYIYEQIPLFIYCKQYLEVITQIVLDRVSEILLLENVIYQEKKFAKKKENQPNFGVCQLSKEEEIELELSLSDAISFGGEEPSKIEKDKVFEQMTAQKTMPKGKDKKGKDYDYNIQKYSLYEINLAYKVFCTLKKRVKKRAKRRSLISN